MDIRRIGSIKEGDQIVGNRTRVKVVKNKVAPPFKDAEFDIRYGEGISRQAELIDLAVAHEIIEKTGTWYSLGKDRLGQGKENARQYLVENPEIADRIEEQLRERLQLPIPSAAKTQNEQG
jgi:recombination protein RecA